MTDLTEELFTACVVFTHRGGLVLDTACREDERCYW